MFDDDENLDTWDVTEFETGEDFLDELSKRIDEDDDMTADGIMITFTVNVMGYRRGDTAYLPVETAERYLNSGNAVPAED